MKFFTPELYLDLNSRDLDRVENAHEKWEDAIDRYRKHLASIESRLSPNAGELARSLCLHDGTFLGLALMYLPAPNAKLAIVTLQQDEAERFLFYLVSKDPLVEERQDWPFSANAPVYWLYDEFDIRPDGQHLHEALLSDGRTLTISFYEMWHHTAESGEIGFERSAMSTKRRSIAKSTKPSRRAR